MHTPNMEIIEQPAAEIHFCNERGRYSSAHLIGKHSTEDNPTFPMVLVKELQHDEDLFVEATCVWSDGRVHKAYPFMLYGGHFSSYIWWAKVDTVTRIATFSKLFLKSLEVTPMKNSLKLGKRKNVDTFNKNNAANRQVINTKKIRLCFRLYGKNKKEPIGEPIFSNIIHCRENLPPLNIVRISHKIAPKNHSIEVTLFCNKLNRNISNNIAIKFYRGIPGESNYWEDYGKIIKIHKQVAIVFKTPVYTRRSEMDNEVVMAFIQMYNVSNGECSNTLKFFLVPTFSVPPNLYVPSISEDPSHNDTNAISSPVVSSTTPPVPENDYLFSYPLRLDVSSQSQQRLCI